MLVSDAGLGVGERVAVVGGREVIAGASLSAVSVFFISN